MRLADIPIISPRKAGPAAARAPFHQVSRASLRALALLPGVLLAIAGAGPAMAQAQAWPTRPVKLMVSWPAGGGGDTVARLLAERMSKNMVQQVIVENRPGAGGTIGTLSVVRSEPDGHTLLFAAPSELSVASATFKALPYDPVKDLQPISLIMRGPYLLVANPNFAPNTLAELIAWARANPGKVTYSSFGNNTLNHLYGEMLKANAGFDALHVPYKGSTPSIIDLMGGQVNYTFDNVGTVLPLVKAGKLKAIAVMAPQRLAAAPTIPTMAEAGMPNFDVGTWLGVLAPAKTPRPLVDRIHAEIVAALNSPDMRTSFEERSVQPVGNTPEEFGRLISGEVNQWQKLAAKIGLKQE